MQGLIELCRDMRRGIARSFSMGSDDRRHIFLEEELDSVFCGAATQEDHFQIG